jgi:hypothetical protein
MALIIHLEEVESAGLWAAESQLPPEVVPS